MIETLLTEQQVSEQQMAASYKERYLTEREVADLLQLSVSTLRHWRVDRTGPQAIRISNRVRYPESGLKAYLDCCPQVGGELNAANGHNEETN